MTKLLIYGNHNVGKTYLLGRILRCVKYFILVDSTCEEGKKSLINMYPSLFDIVIKPNEISQDIFFYSHIGIDVSWNLERYFDSNNPKFLKSFYKDIDYLLYFFANCDKLIYLLN